MKHNPLESIESLEIDIDETAVLEGLEGAPPKLDLNTLPPVVVSGTTLIDFGATPSPVLRSSVSLALLFASRVANKAVKDGDDEDDWLAKYTETLSDLGFRLSGSQIVHSTFKKKNVAVHKAIIPFLTLAFGGGAVGALIIQALKSLQEMDADSPWITLFDKQSRRFSLSEMHFAAVGSNETDTTIHYAVARLNVDTKGLQILFFKFTKSDAQFDSTTTRMTADNGLLAAAEPKLKARLLSIIDETIAGKEI